MFVNLSAKNFYTLCPWIPYTFYTIGHAIASFSARKVMVFLKKFRSNPYIPFFLLRIDNNLTAFLLVFTKAKLCINSQQLSTRRECRPACAVRIHHMACHTVKAAARAKRTGPPIPFDINQQGLPGKPGKPCCVETLMHGNAKAASYFIMPATSSAKLSSRFCRPSPFAKRVKPNTWMEAPISLATDSTYLPTLRSPSLTNC